MTRSRVLLTVLLVFASMALTGAQEPTASQEARPATAPAPFRFTLAADGLPRDGRWKSTPVVADFNKDGLLDLAVHLRLGNGPSVWFGNGKGQWTDASNGLKSAEATSCGGGLRPADVNRDGHLDLVVADHCHGVFVYLGDGTGNWKVATARLRPTAATKIPEGELNTFEGSEDVIVADIDGNGRQDLIVAGADEGGLTVYLGDGSGKRWKEVRGDGLPSPDDPEPDDEHKAGWAMELVDHDMNGDGRPDVVASYYAGPRVWLADGKAKWKNGWQGLPAPMVGGLFRGLSVADINEDGRPDFAIANVVNGPEVYLQNADGSWQATPDVMPPLRGGAEAVALGDLDLDGHVDLVVGGRPSTAQGASYGLWVLRGDGRGGWTQAESSLPDAGLEVTWGASLADVNGDGALDVLVAIGGDIGQTPTDQEERMKKYPLPHVQVWLNDAKKADTGGS